MPKRGCVADGISKLTFRALGPAVDLLLGSMFSLAFFYKDSK